MKELKKEIHEKYLVDYTITAPEFNIKKYANLEVWHDAFQGLIANKKFPFRIFKGNKKLLPMTTETMLNNFAIERGDLTHYSDDGIGYFIVTNKLKENLQVDPGKWVCIGFFEVYDEIIQIAYIHPSLRNREICSHFLLLYAKDIGPLFLQPPISKAMEGSVKKVTKFIFNDEGFKEHYIESVRDFLKRKINDDRIDQLTIDEIPKLLQSYSFLNLSADEGKIPKDPESQKKMLQCTLEMLFMIRDNPELEAGLKKYALDNPEMMQQIESMYQPI